ncbi:MAG: helix-turn-helix domain-containing protein [Candidatus Binataceae bacterium]
MVTELEARPVAANDDERATLNIILSRFLANHKTPGPKLVGPKGEEIELPESLYHELRQLVYHLAHGRAVVVVPLNRELTTQEAADLLNVSRPFLVKLLEQGSIPFAKTGTHRRISVGDLMAYKQRRDAERQRALAHLTQMSQEMGLYE